MARTPLLRMFESLVQDFKEAERSGRPVDEVQQERRRMRPTRRDFLKAGAVCLGVGGQLVDPKAVAAGDFARITHLAKQYVEIVKQHRAG